MKKGQAIFTGMLLGIVIIFFGIFQNGQGLNEKRYKKLNLVLEREVTSMDPAIAYNDDALTLISQSIETLYQYHYLKRPFEIEPLLADGLPKVSEDGLVYTIKIKKGIYFHDHPAFLGKKRELKAYDFINQFKRLIFKPLNSNGRWVVENKIKGANKFSLKAGSDIKKIFTLDLAGVRALDDYTLQIELIQPDPNLMYFLAMSFTAPVPKEIILYYDNNLDNTLVGTGPYILKESEVDKWYRFLKNPNFRNELYPSSGDRYANTQELLKYAKKSLPFIDELVFHVLPVAEERFSKFLEGGVDLMNIPSSKMDIITNPQSDLYQKTKEKGVQTKMFSTLIFRWLGFNMQDALFKKRKFLREAIAYAIDYEEYSKILNRNTSLKANSIFNPGISGYNPSQNIPFRFNLKKAKELLKKHGHANGKGLPVIRYSTRGRRENNIAEAEFIKKSLSQIGLEVQIEVLDFKDFLKLGRAGKLQFWTDNWIYDYPDAENLLQLLLSSNHPGINKSAYKNKKFDFLYGRLSQTRELAERLAYMEKMEKLVLSDLPWIPLYYETSYTLNHSALKNYRKSFFTRNFVKYLDLK